jgi:hypothetical protein
MLVAGFDVGECHCDGGDDDDRRRWVMEVVMVMVVMVMVVMVMMVMVMMVMVMMVMVMMVMVIVVVAAADAYGSNDIYSSSFIIMRVSA